MNDEKKKSIQDQLDQGADLEDVHYRLIAHIRKQNQARNGYFSNIQFGEPIWDFLLDLMVSEYSNQSSTSQDISQRLKISEQLCNRCADYLLDRNAILENRNQYIVEQFPWLVSEETKLKIKQWLNVCIDEAPLS